MSQPVKKKRRRTEEDASDFMATIMGTLPSTFNLGNWFNAGGRRSPNVAMCADLCIKGPLLSSAVARSYQYRQRVFDEILRDAVALRPMIVFGDGSRANTPLLLCYKFVALRAKSLGQWFRRGDALLLRDLQTARCAILHIMMRFIVGVDDHGGSATLDHVLVDRNGQLYGISYGDDGCCDQVAPKGSTVADLLRAERWSDEARHALAVICSSSNESPAWFLERLQALNCDAVWSALSSIIAQHRISLKTLSATKRRTLALISALKRSSSAKLCDELHQK